MSDVLERLRAANPVTDLEAVRHGVAPLPHAPVRRRHRGAVALAGVAALACAVALIGLPADDGPATDVAAAAERALDPGNSILHIVMRTSQVGPGHVKGSSSEELWLGPDGRGRMLSLNGDGSVAGDEPLGGYDERTGIGTDDPVSAARSMIALGRLKPAGRITLHGRPAVRFLTRDATWYFNAASFRPLEIITRVRQAQITARTEFVRYERLADNVANRKLLTPPRVIHLR
jgi:hypothetical protein